MPTFATLEDWVRLKVGQNIPAKVDTLLRRSENVFIEKTLCTESLYNVSTSTLKGGVLSELYDLPTGFIHEYKVEWNGERLAKASKRAADLVYYTDNDLYEGTPEVFSIENEDIRLIPKPSSHGYLHIWYCIYNTTETTSPIIPVAEHYSICDHTISQIFEMPESLNLDLALYYNNKFLNNCKIAYNKYKRQRVRQLRITDATGVISYNRSLQGLSKFTEP